MEALETLRRLIETAATPIRPEARRDWLREAYATHYARCEKVDPEAIVLFNRKAVKS